MSRIVSRFCVVGLMASVAFLRPSSATAQSESAKPALPRAAVPCPTTRPEYPGGWAAVLEFLRTNTQYPAQARPQRLRGNVMVEFIVDSTGAVRNSVVKEGLGGGCDEEAVRVVGLLGRFTPAQRDCRPVSTRVAVPVAFAPPARPAK